jgi:DnaJ-class molecular chaperone
MRTKEETATIPKDELKFITCPRCNGTKQDPCSKEIYRELSCTLCKGVGKIIMANTEYYLG